MDIDEKAIVAIVRREIAELAFEQMDDCDKHWREQMPLALMFKEMFRVLGVRAGLRLGRNAKLKKLT